jgi:hypothetical protein
MADHHIHIHLHGGPYQSMVQDAGTFEESKHAREGGKFASGGGGSSASARPSTASKFAAKHNPAAAVRKGQSSPGASSEQEQYEKNKLENPLL